PLRPAADRLRPLPGELSALRPRRGWGSPRGLVVRWAGRRLRKPLDGARPPLRLPPARSTKWWGLRRLRAPARPPARAGPGHPAGDRQPEPAGGRAGGRPRRADVLVHRPTEAGRGVDPSGPRANGAGHARPLAPARLPGDPIGTAARDLARRGELADPRGAP